MIKEFQKLDLSDDTLRVDQIFEGFRHLFNRNFDLGFMVVSAAYHAIRAMANLLYIFKLVLDQKARALKSLSRQTYLRI